MGSLFIKQAFIVARRRPEGISFGLNGVEMLWQDYSGLSILDVIKKLKAIKAIVDTPDIIILHFGGNDLCGIGLKSIRFHIYLIIHFINDNFYNCKNMWSQILPRTSWRYSYTLAAMEESRKRINAYAATRVIAKNGA